jgi:CubicO group peptidase (beta-lactamase class C family)
LQISDCRLQIGTLAIASLLAAPLALGSHAQPPAAVRPAVLAQAARDLGPASPESQGFSPERLARIDAAMTQKVDDRTVAGIVTLLERHGKVVHTSVAGRLDQAKPDPLKTDTIFRIYSMTKPVTGVAMMILYEEGKWQLNDPVSRYIPEFQKLKVYAGSNDDGSPKLEDARRSLTMRELMTHTGGLGYVLTPDNPVDQMIIKARVLDPAAPLKTMIAKLATMPLKSQPGTRWAYSIGVDVQGYLIEQFSGLSFADFAKTRIFDPLGMKDTGFFVPREKLARLAQRHKGAGGSLVAETLSDPTVVPLGASGGGGLFSTATDYARFCDMLLQGGQFGGTRLLAPRTVEMMRTNHVNPDALKTMGAGTGWGMDFQVVMDAAAAGEAVPTGTYSWWGIGGTWFWIDPVNDVAFVGMVSHEDTRVTRPLHALSRSLVYASLTN